MGSVGDAGGLRQAKGQATVAKTPRNAAPRSPDACRPPGTPEPRTPGMFTSLGGAAAVVA